MTDVAPMRGVPDGTVTTSAGVQQRAGLAALLTISQPGDVPVPAASAAVTVPFGSRLRARTRAGLLALATAGRLQLLAVLAAQAGLSLRLVWSNTAFQDEALYLRAGQLELAHWRHGAPVPAFQTYFSGAPVVYPPLGALADSWGGLAAARGLSLLFMLGATVLLHGAARALFDRRTAVAAAALFAVFGAAVQLGAFATYDAMALFLTALAAWLVVRARGWLSEPFLIFAGLVLALADATKYASALWNPVVIAMAALTAAAGSRIRRVFRAVRLAAYTAVPVAAALRAGGAAYRHGITWTTLNRQITTLTAPLRVLDIAWGWLALLLLLGVIGVWLAWYDRGRPWVLPLVLLAAGLLAPLEQARISDITSLHKHVVFGAWFLCMVAGYAVGRVSYLDGRLTQGTIIGGTLIGVLAVTGYAQASSFAGSWPSLKVVLPALQRAVRADHGKCLIFQQDAAYYYLPPADLSGGVTGPYSFTYADVAAQKKLSGPDAMAAAIRNGYFAVVEVDASRGDATYQLLTAALRQSGQYALMSSASWQLHPGEPTQVWRRSAGGGR